MLHIQLTMPLPLPLPMPMYLVLITIIHKPLLQIPTQPPLRLNPSPMLRTTIPPPLQRPPPCRIHMHADHILPLLIPNTDRVVAVSSSPAVCMVMAIIVNMPVGTPPSRSQHQPHQPVPDAIAQRARVRGDGVEW